MTFVKYQNTNNANSSLIAGISASATTILIVDGDQNLFPSSFPFLLTLEKLDSDGNVITREIVKATAGNQNSFTVVRGAGICVQDDTASNRSQDNTAHAFDTNDKVSLYRTAEQVKDIQDKLEASVNSSSIANEYDSTATYEIGDVVMYKGDRYICNTDISTAEDFDNSKRTKTDIQNNLDYMQTVVDNIAGSSEILKYMRLVDLTAVGGGGGGHAGYNSGGITGGGGGGGGAVYVGKYLGTLDAYSIAVGCGGASGIDGGNSVFGPLLLKGGKAGCNNNGGESGSGFAGGTGCSYSSTSGAGGGGATGRGTDQISNMQGGTGGTGMCGYGGGGGGGSMCGSKTGYGCDGGGNGGRSGTAPCGCNATNCGGGGGGGADTCPGGSGGNGIVIVKYPADGSWNICCATGGTITCETIDSKEYIVHTFTADGTFSIVC